LRGFHHAEKRPCSRLVRKRINAAGELKPMFTDLYDPAANLLIEAKGTTTRDAMRMALGQLYDDRRFIEPEPALAVLVPEPPRPDLVTLAHVSGVALIARDGDRSPSRARLASAYGRGIAREGARRAGRALLRSRDRQPCPQHRRYAVASRTRPTTESA
jgi:hypothetical protein